MAPDVLSANSAVRDAEHYVHNLFLEIERDLEHGAVVFEIEFLEAGKKWELDVAEDGTLLQRRED